ncbi:hypothetical protein EJ06DRAFT_169010 [Trichodelitschia bisporula]|uniref:Uncharacterized protein n=1 Tax=Trichodelitschia bisporula TaxID=703511 RepID=A0A6G1HN44_9PEZI|nr:hypothetical protein EJ06DRAFT_169010 [Trichodelitschia bisporula]
MNRQTAPPAAMALTSRSPPRQYSTALEPALTPSDAYNTPPHVTSTNSPPHQSAASSLPSNIPVPFRKWNRKNALRTALRLPRLVPLSTSPSLPRTRLGIHRPLTPRAPTTFTSSSNQTVASPVLTLRIIPPTPSLTRA